MNSNITQSSDDPAPFGTRPRRSWTPVYLLGFIYAVWFGLLLWMAATQVGWK